MKIKNIKNRIIAIVCTFTLLFSGTVYINLVTISAGANELIVSKTSFKQGEAVMVRANCDASDSWVGIYKENEEPGDTQSLYWYWVKDYKNLAVDIRTTTNNRGTEFTPGRYKIILFGDGQYGKRLKTEYITLSDLAPLKSISYSLDSATDGFADGTVVVTKDKNNEKATDCIMYWADASGKPLEGYTSLAKFKLNETETQHAMYSHTIIPDGAKKLIAYTTDGEELSDEAVSVDLPNNSSYKFNEEPLREFQIISDIHVTTDSGATGECKKSNIHFSQMLNDVKQHSTNSMGIFINGDIANSGSEEEFKKVRTLYNDAQNAGNGTLPAMHMAIGNHDWIKGNPNNQFQKYCLLFNPSLQTMPTNVYYSETVNGYNFIYLGGESAGLRADLSSTQLSWFDETMQRYTEEDPKKPVFVFLHQSFKNTVAGSLDGQGWDGVSDETSHKNIMKKYNNIVLLNGHSHWELNSESCLYPGNGKIPVALNTAAVGYLWSSYNVTSGEFAEGSHGYYVRVYEDKVVFLGRDFENNKYIPSAVFVLDKKLLKCLDYDEEETTTVAPTEPVQTTVEPIETTTKANETTKADVTTKGGETTKEGVTTKEDATTKVPVITTKSLIITTKEGDTTKAPIFTTKEGRTTRIPTFTTRAPVFTTKSPSKTTEVPVVTTNKPKTTTIAPETATAVKVKAPGKTKVKKVVKKKTAKKLKVTLKVVKGAVGYQVAVYKSKKNAKKNKKALVKKYVTKIKFTIKSKKIKNRKKLFVKARAYALNKGIKVFGKWSGIKKVNNK